MVDEMLQLEKEEVLGTLGEQGGKELKRERRQGWDSGLECNQNEGTRFHRLYRER